MSHVSDLRLRDPLVESARRTLLDGGHLSQEDGLRLYDAPVLELGRLANAFARDRHGDRVYFTVNRQLNPTNVCVLACRFCDYAKKPGAEGAYTMTKEQILDHVDPEIREIHIVGGLHNKWRFDDYLDIIRWVREKKPDLSVKAYTAVEIDFFCRLTKKPAEWVLGELKAAGLDALPGGGAEVFSERVRREIFHQKIGAQRWLEIHEVAHGLGIPSNATLPSLGAARPAMSSSSVDLPQPDGPTTAKNSPRASSRSSGPSASTPGPLPRPAKTLRTPRRVTCGDGTAATSSPSGRRAGTACPRVSCSRGRP